MGRSRAMRLSARPLIFSTTQSFKRFKITNEVQECYLNTKYQFGSHRQSGPKAIHKTEISPIMTYGGLRGSNAPDVEVIFDHQFFVMGILLMGNFLIYHCNPGQLTVL
jgi:hypothetical protein